MPKRHTRTDEELAVETRSTNKEAYGELVRRYEHKLMRYATYLLHNEQRAMDVVQEAFIKAYVNLNGFDPKKKFSSWIYRMVHNEAMNAVKKYQKEIPMIQDRDWESGENIEREFDRKELIKQVHACLEAMPLLYAEPLALYYLDGASYEEISDIVRIPMGTVAVRIHRAKVLMKRLCQKNE